jgi:octaprenyl-diphosphate synthase
MVPLSPSAPANDAYSQALLLVTPGMQEVDEVIQRRLASEVVLVEQVARYIIEAGGKRMRPALLLLCGKALGNEPSKTSKPPMAELAAIIEFIHTATLLHDDVVDESGLRRSRETANAVFGNAPSILVGDFLYSRAFQMMVEIGSMPVMAVLAEATNIIAEGEVLQLMNCQNPEVDEARYLQVIRYKTAKLFEAAASLPAVFNGAPTKVVEAFSAYGRHLGTAFQLTDDLLDYAGSEDDLGKRLGDDLREGKPTLPLIYLLQHGRPNEQQLVRRAIEEPEKANLGAVIQCVQSTGALQYTQAAAEHEVQLGEQALASIEQSVYRTSLLDLLRFVVSRRS